MNHDGTHFQSAYHWPDVDAFILTPVGVVWCGFVWIAGGSEPRGAAVSGRHGNEVLLHWVASKDHIVIDSDSIWPQLPGGSDGSTPQRNSCKSTPLRTPILTTLSPQSTSVFGSWDVNVARSTFRTIGRTTFGSCCRKKFVLFGVVLFEPKLRCRDVSWRKWT